MLAIIPARSGSKGLPGKNIRPMLGLPMIAHTIRAAAAAERISEIVVSTDSEEIAGVAREHGASVPFLRPAELSGDKAAVTDALSYTIRRLEEERGEPIPAFCELQPTSPLRNAGDIDGAVGLFLERDADSVISFVKSEKPLAWARELDREGRILPSPASRASNRQEHPDVYWPNGAVYVVRSALLAAGSFYTEKSYAYLMPPERSADIDTLLDFQIAEFLMTKGYHEKK